LPIGEILRVLPHILDISLLPFITKKSKVPILTVPMTENDRTDVSTRWIGSGLKSSDQPGAAPLFAAARGPQSAMARSRA
jgi:hypothetical protein